MKGYAHRSPATTIGAVAIAVGTVLTGYVSLGALPAFVFTFGFLGGFVAWATTESRPPFSVIRWPYYITFALFVAHKVEERELDFFPALSSITGVPMPEPGSWPTIVLYGSAALWLLIPALIGRRIEFGYYLAWTFFLSMGVTELAHFVFPLLTGDSYGYFPGMASTIVLAPVAWWGIIRLVSNRDAPA